MKTRYILIIAAVIIVALVLWRHSHSLLNHEPALSNNVEVSLTNRMFAPKAGRQEAVVVKAPGLSPESNFPAWNDQRLKQMAEGMASAQNQWRTPIEFYGMVVDEQNNPVSGAQIEFDANDTSVEGTSFYHTDSDANGHFSIKNIEGKVLGVKVNKEGYYSYTPPVGLTFWYAGGEVQTFIPDVANPVVFRLKKKGVAERLIHIHAHGNLEGLKTPKDGSPIGVSLTTGGQVNEQGDLVVQCWVDDKVKLPGKDYNWKCQVSVPGGGILLRTNDLEFQAPTSGYQPSDVIDMPASLGNQWSSDAKRNYFVRLANGNYARINFEMIVGGNEFFQLESFLNPNGSRNLEFDPSDASNP